ncbi:amino acid adenylation domain-containing protein [Shewanella denitrificans]
MGYVDSLGRIRFLGRADQQVKINGFRVELEAINRALSAIDGIKRGETIAITPNKPGGAQRLVGFVQQEREVVPDTSEVTDVTELLTHLSPTLPGYMLPGVLLSVTEWPLTRTGKVDRNTLQAWYEQWLLEHQLNTRSLTPTERQITKVWESVLGCKTLNHSAHFYQLGGNSLLLLKAHNELVRVFQQQIDLSLCLQNPILSELAEAISSSQTTATVEEPEVQLSAQSLFPLTTEQKRLWLTEIIQPSIAYNIPIFLPVPKTINYEQIQTTVNQLVKANPALGLKLVELNGEVSQQIRSIDDILVEHISVNTAQLQKCKVGLGQKAINLAEGVMCAHFIETDTSNHWLVLNIHHICFDGQSLLPLITAFNQLLSGRSIERDLGFFQHIQWQQTTQYRELIQEQKKYWQDRLAALEAPTVLPYLSQPNESRKSRNLSIPLDPTLVANITQLARELNTTEFTLWSSLTTLLLGRLNQVNYATLVTPVAKRLHAYESESIGFFANTLLLHSAWTESISFRDFISQKHTEITNDLCHQLVSLGTLLSMQKQQGKEIDTLSEVLFSMTKPELGNNELEVGVNPDVKFDLGLTLSFSTKGDYAQIEYRKSAYSINMLEKTVEALLFLAQQVHANPDVSIGALELTQTITKTELGCSNTFLSVPKQIINLAHRHENEIAVTDGQTELTYHMLVESAQRMAVHLQHAGIKKGDRVAVLVRRQAMLPVTLLAILITGAVYVPLDPEYPVSRNQYILYDAQPSVVIYDIPPDTFSGELPSGLQWISLPSLLKPLPNIELQPVTITADDLSHIIYTSGSTGQPKGVAIRHDGLASLQEWAKSVYVPEDFSLVYSGTSICFDLSVFEIFITWSLGGSVYFAENSLQLVDDMHKHAISLLNVVPSILTEVLKHQSLSSSIRIVNLAGEPLPPSLAKALYKQSEHIRVFNLYGPSEDTTYSTWFEVEKEKCDDMLIGQPLPGTQAIISDHSGRLLPDYFVGELYLSGRGLAKGYWNKPDLNEERFIRHNNGQVFYKTGDLVRRVEQQQLEYIGRIDDQVKLRGFRIELEEISHLVLADEQVLASCTLVIKHDDTDQIVCFFVSDERDVNINRLKERLKKNLPNYMVPTHFQQIEKMPTTPSGKQDKKALNTLFKPYSNCAVTDDEQNHSEYVQWCCSQFTSFLPDKKVGYESDFFESGGTPSLASSLLNRIRTDFSVKISFEKLSSNSNPVSLGELIESLIELQEELNNEIII